jgi:hypothetical protein
MSDQGTIGILNVGAGDTKLTFDKNNLAERIRSARIVADMIRRGYILLIEVERDGVKTFQRCLEFDENHCEYIIADLDPEAAAEPERKEPRIHEQSGEATGDSGAETASETIPIAGGAKRGQRKKHVDASKTRGVAVARSAGG